MVNEGKASQTRGNLHKRTYEMKGYMAPIDLGEQVRELIMELE